MKKFNIAATKSSPEINLDPENSIFEIAGESYSENCWSFYKPMFEWLTKFFAVMDRRTIEIDMEIIYFNSSSSKIFMDFFEMLDEQAQKGWEIAVNWRYHRENETAMECGEEFMEDVSSIEFKLVELDT